MSFELKENALSSTPIDLGCQKNIDVIKRFVELERKLVVDAGCGGLAMTLQLAQCQSRVLAIDPDPIQAALNRKTTAIPNVQFVETGAQSIPAEDRSVDGVFFCYSLHHVPARLHSPVFAEVFRVLKQGGFLYVIEPTDSPLNQVIKWFHDEDVQRCAAQDSLQFHAADRFEQHHAVTYHSFTKYDSFNDFADQYSARSYNGGYGEADVRQEGVRQEFETQGAPDYNFLMPKRVDCFLGLIV